MDGSKTSLTLQIWVTDHRCTCSERSSLHVKIWQPLLFGHRFHPHGHDLQPPLVERSEETCLKLANINSGPIPSPVKRLVQCCLSEVESPEIFPATIKLNLDLLPLFVAAIRSINLPELLMSLGSKF